MTRSLDPNELTADERLLLLCTWLLQTLIDRGLVSCPVRYVLHPGAQRTFENMRRAAPDLFAFEDVEMEFGMKCAAARYNCDADETKILNELRLTK